MEEVTRGPIRPDLTNPQKKYVAKQTNHEYKVTLLVAQKDDSTPVRVAVRFPNQACVRYHDSINVYATRNSMHKI